MSHPVEEFDASNSGKFGDLMLASQDTMPDIIGCTMKADYYAEAEPWPQDATRGFKLKVMLSKYPSYLFEELSYFVFPVVVTCMMPLVGGLTATPVYEGVSADFVGSLKDMEYTTSSKLWLVMYCIALPTLVVVQSSMFVTMFNWRKIQGVLAILVFCCGIVPVSMYIIKAMLYDRVGDEDEDSFEKKQQLDGLTYIIMLISNLLGIFYTFMRVGRITENPRFACIQISTNLYVNAIYGTVRRRAQQVVQASDLAKLVILLVICPIVYEVATTAHRVLARSLRNNHPSTSCVIMGTMIFWSKLWARFLILTMQSTSSVLLASVLLGIVEFVRRTSARARDKGVYTCLFKKNAQMASANGKTIEPHALMNNKRNKSLRTQIDLMESMMECAFVIALSLSVIVYDISPDGVNKVDTGFVFFGMAIQLVIEFLTDFLVILVLVVFQDVPYFHEAKAKFVGYWWAMAAFPLYGMAILTTSFFPFMLCRTEEIKASGAAQFVYCQPA